MNHPLPPTLPAVLLPPPMRKPIRVAASAVAVLALAIASAFALGMMLPRRHVAATSALLPARAEQVWLAISDMGSQTTWRSDIKSVERLPDHEGRAVWMQHTGMGDWALELTEVAPPLRLVATVADSSQGFGGTWTYEVAAAGDSTRLTITEHGFVDNPLFRFLSHFVFGLHQSQETYLRDLGRHLGGEPAMTREV